MSTSNFICFITTIECVTFLKIIIWIKMILGINTLNHPPTLGPFAWHLFKTNNFNEKMVQFNWTNFSIMAQKNGLDNATFHFLHHNWLHVKVVMDHLIFHWFGITNLERLYKEFPSICSNVYTSMFLDILIMNLTFNCSTSWYFTTSMVVL